MTNQEYEIQKLRKELDRLRKENGELVYQHQLAQAEIVKLRRWIGALEEEKGCCTTKT